MPKRPDGPGKKPFAHRQHFGPPSCKKCGERHYAIIPCDKAVEYNVQKTHEAFVAEAAKPKPRPVVPEYLTDREREPSDQLVTMERVAPNVFVRKE